MASFNLPNVDGMTSVDELKNAVGKMAKELTWLMQNLDWKNINELNIQLNGGAAVTINDSGITVNNGVFDTFTVDINGEITATGMNIQSSTGYPKVVMNPATKLFAAYKSATEYMEIQADYTGAPSFNLIHDGNIVGRIDMILGYPEYYGKGGLDLLTDNNGHINLKPGGTGTVWLNSGDFSKLRNDSTTLQAALNAKATSGVSTGLSGSHNHGIPNGTQFKDINGITRTFTDAPTHSHAQT